MNVIAPRTLRAFWRRHPHAEGPLREWEKLMRRSSFHDFFDLRRTFGSADWASPYVIFNIGGNKYRLVAGINFRTQTVYVKKVMTHEEYEHWNRQGRPP